VMPELLEMVDATLGVDSADAASLTTAFYALTADLKAKGETLTPRTIASLLDNHAGLQFMLDSADGEICTAALSIQLTDDAGQAVAQLLLGTSDDVAMPAMLMCPGLALVVGDPDESEYDPQGFVVFAKSSATMSAAKAKANREMVARALMAIQPFTADDTHAENLRRQALRLLKSSLIQ